MCPPSIFYNVLQCVKKLNCNCSCISAAGKIIFLSSVDVLNVQNKCVSYWILSKHCLFTQLIRLLVKLLKVIKTWLISQPIRLPLKSLNLLKALLIPRYNLAFYKILSKSCIILYILSLDLMSKISVQCYYCKTKSFCIRSDICADVTGCVVSTCPILLEMRCPYEMD